MFFPMLTTQPAHIYHVEDVMPQGCAVKLSPDGTRVIPALDGLNVLGFAAQSVITYADRPREFDLAPQLFFGRPFTPVMVGRPGMGVGTNVGVWMEKNALFSVDIRDNAGNSVAGLAPGTALMVGANGLLQVQDNVMALGVLVRPNVAVVEQNGMTSFTAGSFPAMDQPITSTTPQYIVRLTNVAL
jgi:hypothetical protein